MTKTQIETILDELGYELDKPIKMPEVSSIYLTTDNVSYPSNDTRLVFSTENGAGLLLVYRGYEDGNTFKYSKGYPDEIISFDAIAGFTMVSDTNIFEPFRYSRAV